MSTPTVTIARSHTTAFHPCGGVSFNDLNIENAPTRFGTCIGFGRGGE